MSQFVETQQPTPELFFETIQSYQRTESLKAAVELDLFTAIAEGKETADALAERCGASARGIRILSDYLVVIGFLTKNGNRYALAPDSAAFLNRNSPVYLGESIKFLAAPTVVDSFKDLAASIRNGGSVAHEAGPLAPENPIWVEFARHMAPLASLPAELLAALVGGDSGHKVRVLDIAAGHGLFGISIAKHNPNAEVVAVDWPNVLEIASENASAAGVDDRFSTIPGSAFEVEWGNGYDIVLLTNFLHHFHVPTCEELLRKVHDSLNDGGRAVTLEMIPNEDRVSPPIAAKFGLVMLAITPGGDAYTFRELERMFRKAGFSSSEIRALPPTFQQVVLSQK